ncbi:MAG TPA: hypothetical protein DEA44_15270, partial [Firmicutes bacterium]|nr:hypothetical protein [Bacillota bacterium]
NGEWVYGNRVYMQGNDGYTVGMQMLSGDGYRPWASIQVDPKTVGQFTGTYDNKGREIYEGDFLAACFKAIPCCVEWDEDILGFGASNKKKHIFIDVPYWKHRNIVGNIHDNPELLEVA